MSWQLFFIPFFAYPYVWLALIVAAAIWLSFRALSLYTQKAAGTGLIAPAFWLMVLSSPVWIGGIYDDVRCRNAGLYLGGTVLDSTATLHWDSFPPDPHGYPQSLGNLEVPTVMGRSVMNELVRAVSEGRIRAFDIPNEPVRVGIPDTERLYQRFYLAPADGSMGQCLKPPFDSRWQFAPGTCLAFVESQGVQATYLLKGSALQSDWGNSVAIVDRANGKTIAQHTFVTQDHEETALARFGIRKLRPRSCTPETRSTDLATGLVALVFKPSAAPPVDTSNLETHLATPWIPVPAPPLGEPVPKGAEGIAYWIRKGAVKKLGQKDLDIWRRATRDSKWEDVPDNAYLIEDEIYLPDGLSGGHSVRWVLPPGRNNIPPGPRGHNIFYSVDHGCIWPSTRCRSGY